MDTTLLQKFPFILDRNLAKANFTENHVCTSCDTVVLGTNILATASDRFSCKYSRVGLGMHPGIYPFNPLGWVLYIKNLFFFVKSVFFDETLYFFYMIIVITHLK